MAKPLHDWIDDDVRHVQGRPTRWLSERYFFRDPIRPSYADSGYFFAPADGVILYQREVAATDPLVEIKGRAYTLREALRNTAFDASCLVIGIFMTLYDVHVNRMPFAGFLRFESLPPIDTYNHPMLELEDALLRGSTSGVQSADHVFSNQRMVNRIFAPALGLTYYLLQIADYDVSAILPFDQQRHCRYAQGQRFSEIRFGSQVDLIIPLSPRWRFETLLPETTHVEAGTDPLVRVCPVKGQFDER